MILPIDLRSDFISTPTKSMIKAIVKAASQPCSFAFREDPFQKRLEQLASKLLGKEDALLFPTCTMCNQVAIHIFCAPGDHFIAEAQSHVLSFESSSPSVLTGAVGTPVRGEKGIMEPELVGNILKSSDGLRLRFGLICLENTHLKSGGRALPIENMVAMKTVANHYSLPIHLDGARVFNAAVSLDVSPEQIARSMDSVSISLNKGLSAPMGAILAGSEKFIQEALRVQQIFGGGWRPTQIIASAGIIALEEMIDRLADDHVRAKYIANGIAECDGIYVDLDSVETNIVLIEVKNAKLTSEQIIYDLASKGILVNPFGERIMRMVTHRGIGLEEAKYVIDKFRKIIRGNASL